MGWRSIAQGVFEPSVAPAASIVVEHLAQFASEGLGLAGVSELAPRKPPWWLGNTVACRSSSSAVATAVRPVNVSSDSSPTATTRRVGAATSAATSGR
jgi:hypothetical protein